MAGEAGELTIGQVSQLLGVPVPTLRSWHLRYGVAQPERTVGGHRRYARADVALLQALSSAVARGIAPRSAAQALTQPGPDVHRPVELLWRLLEHATAGDQPGVVAVLDEGERALGLEPAIHQLLVPALQEVGRRWEVGLIGVDAEHLATTATRRWIDRRTGTAVVRHTTAPVLLAAATGAQAAVVTAHQVSLRRPAVEALRTLAASDDVQLYYAGAAFESDASRRSVPGTYLGTSLPEAADLVEAELR